MSFISTMEETMPPGFRFHPRDDELVLDYLLHKLSGRRAGGAYGRVAIVDVDLNKCEPWDLPGKDRAISRGGAGEAAVEMRKTLVFYQGRAPKGRKTEWVMHEFRMEDHHPQLAAARHHHLKDWVLCRVFYKSRTTTPRPSSEEARTSSNELDLPAAPPLAPLIDAYFSGLPALPFKGSVGFGGLLALDTSEKKAIRTVLCSMSSYITSKLELPPNWSQVNGLSQMWNPL